MNVAAVVWWVLNVVGFVPTTWFLVRFRPRRPLRPLSVILLGLVLGYWIWYARSIATIALKGWVPVFDGFIDGAIRLVSLVATDALLIAMLIAFLRVRRKWPDWQPSFHRDEQGD